MLRVTRKMNHTIKKMVRERWIAKCQFIVNDEGSHTLKDKQQAKSSPVSLQ